MKNFILLMFLFGVVFTSCMKEQSKTCVCKDAQGNILQQQTMKTSRKKDLQKFEDDCNKKSVQSTNLNGTTNVPCEITN